MSEPASEKLKYLEVSRIASDDGVVAVVTRRVSDGRVSFKLVKEYDRDKRVEQTPFLARRHVDSLEKLLPQIREAVERAEDEARAAMRPQR